LNRLSEAIAQPLHRRAGDRTRDPKLERVRRLVPPLCHAKTVVKSPFSTATASSPVLSSMKQPVP
jgi:hypothetical protein